MRKCEELVKFHPRDGVTWEHDLWAPVKYQAVQWESNDTEPKTHFSMIRKFLRFEL